jgi:hypothetical protein
MVHVQGNFNRRSSRSQRRLRPGMHERRSMTWTRKGQDARHDVVESASLAQDPSVLLPTDWAKPSPLRRQTFDQSWMRWKAREAEEKEKENLARAQEKEIGREIEREELEMRKMFGGDVGDDVSLCGPMMDVVRFLFEGEIDYIDF